MTLSSRYQPLIALTDTISRPPIPLSSVDLEASTDLSYVNSSEAIHRIGGAQQDKPPFLNDLSSKEDVVTHMLLQRQCAICGLQFQFATDLCYHLESHHH
jgi:hypothetical protein